MLLAALGAVSLVGCAEQQAGAPATAPAAAPPPQAAAVSTTTQRTAIVETVNMRERSVLLRGDAGSQNGLLATIRVGPQVRNLEKFK
jgi:uncharacterized lipoprotein YbaY